MAGRPRKVVSISTAKIGKEKIKARLEQEKKIKVGREHLAEPPEWLSENGKKEFNRVVEEAGHVELLDNLDLGIFTYKASGDIKKVLKDKMFVGPAKDILVESITISKKELQNQEFDFEKIFFDTVGEGENTYVKTKPIIQVDNTYFVANNIKSEERGTMFNYAEEEGGDVKAVYSRIDISSLTLATKEALLPTEELVEITGNKNVLKKLTQVEQDRFDKYMEALQAIFKKDTIFDISGMKGQLKQIFINSLANKSSETEMQSALIQKVQEILANNKETIVIDSEGERTTSC